MLHSQHFNETYFIYLKVGDWEILLSSQIYINLSKTSVVVATIL